MRAGDITLQDCQTLKVGQAKQHGETHHRGRAWQGGRRQWRQAWEGRWGGHGLLCTCFHHRHTLISHPPRQLMPHRRRQV